MASISYVSRMVRHATVSMQCNTDELYTTVNNCVFEYVGKWG
jgi:hypothetical protein